MPPDLRRQLLVELLLLIAEIDEEPAGAVLGVRQAAVLIGAGRPASAIGFLRASPSHRTAALSGLLRRHLLPQAGDD